MEGEWWFCGGAAKRREDSAFFVTFSLRKCMFLLVFIQNKTYNTNKFVRLNEHCINVVVKYCLLLFFVSQKFLKIVLLNMIVFLLIFARRLIFVLIWNHFCFISSLSLFSLKEGRHFCPSKKWSIPALDRPPPSTGGFRGVPICSRIQSKRTALTK